MPKSSGEKVIISLIIGAIIVLFAAIIIPIVMLSSSSSPSSSSSSSVQRSDEIIYIALVVSAIVGLALYFSTDDKSEDTKSTAAAAASSTATTTRPIKDIWKVGQKCRNYMAKNSKGYKEKPFGSKYYYAHNDSNTTGGYKDGLKLEDYRMNGPRLLSRNGLSIETAANYDDGNDDDDGEEKETINVKQKYNYFDDDNNASKNNKEVHLVDIKNITKYLWDDPGDSRGIGTIRIDVLPSFTSPSVGLHQQYIDVKDVKVEDVHATLIAGGGGLLVTIIVTDHGCYQLKINKLYGDASDVKVIIKQKRLLIKIYKKKKNLIAWLQPHKKV